MKPLDKITNIWRSTKKYFVDNLQTAQSIPVYFEREFVDFKTEIENAIKQWVIVDNDGVSHFGSTTNMFLTIYIHSRDDSEGTELYKLRDKLIEMLTDVTDTDQIRRMPLFDTEQDPWVEEAQGLLFLQDESPMYYSDDGTLFKSIKVTLRWFI